MVVWGPLPFAINLVAKLIFTPIQFGMRNLPLAAVDVLIVWEAIIWMVVAVWRHYRWVAVAQVPYFVLVSLATVPQLSLTAMTWRPSINSTIPLIVNRPLRNFLVTK